MIPQLTDEEFLTRVQSLYDTIRPVDEKMRITQMREHERKVHDYYDRVQPIVDELIHLDSIQPLAFTVVDNQPVRSYHLWSPLALLHKAELEQRMKDLQVDIFREGPCNPGAMG